MKMININVGNNTLQVEKGTSVQRLIELMESNNWNPSEWTITYVFPEEDKSIEIEVSTSCGRFEKDRCAELKYEG